MRTRRLTLGQHAALVLLPTSLLVGVAVQTVRVPLPERDKRGARIPPRSIRLVTINLPFLSLVISWQIAA